MLISFMRIREYQWFQYKNGTLDREAFESYMSPVNFWPSSQMSAEWWTDLQGQFDPEFTDFVNSILDGSVRQLEPSHACI